MEGKLHLEIYKSHTSDQSTYLCSLRTQRDRLKGMEMIRKVKEPTDWVSSLAVFEKRHGKLRICIESVLLNKALKRSHYPLPVIEDVLPELADVKVFSKANLKHGFLHIELDNESSLLTTFQTP